MKFGSQACYTLPFAAIALALAPAYAGPVPSYQISDDPNGPVTERMKQLTGVGSDFGLPPVTDPSLSVQSDGSVLVEGTSNIEAESSTEAILYWPNLKSLVQGLQPTRQPIRLLKEVQLEDQFVVVPLVPDEIPWDLEIYSLLGQSYLYAGVMTPEVGLQNAMGDDNISRRVRVAETSDQGKTWVFKKDPVFGTPSFTNWIGHSYGHQLIQSADGITYMFHDMVSGIVDDSTGLPTSSGGFTKTELFARILDPQNPMKTLTSVPEVSGARVVTLSSGEKVYKILGIEDLPLESSHREGGGYLLEGARPRKIEIQKGSELKTLYLILFSTGDYPLKNYTIRAAISEGGILGPYQVYKENGVPKDLGDEMKNSMGFHALGRGFSFDYEGENWLLFHAEADLPGLDYTTTWRDVQQSIFVAPLDIHYDGDELKINIIL
jgi:hypothetical protein